MIRRLTEMDAEELELVDSPEEPTVIFDPARLAAQLSELLELYLARAKEALAEEQMSSKEAVACAKQVAGMLDDTQSGKLQKVDTSTEWPSLRFSAGVGGAGDSPAIRYRPAPIPHPRTRGFSPALASAAAGSPANLAAPPIQSLADAVTAVCQWDEETAILEPWAQLLVRMNQLTQRLSADIEEWKASCEESVKNSESRLSSRDYQREESRLEDLPALAAGRDSFLITTSSVGVHPPVAGTADAGGAGEGATGVGGTGVGGTGDSPVLSSKPAPARATGSASPQPPTTDTCPPKCREAVRRRNQKPPHAIHQNPRGP